MIPDRHRLGDATFRNAASVAARAVFQQGTGGCVERDAGAVAAPLISPPSPPELALQTAARPRLVELGRAIVVGRSLGSELHRAVGRQDLRRLRWGTGGEDAPQTLMLSACATRAAVVIDPQGQLPGPTVRQQRSDHIGAFRYRYEPPGIADRELGPNRQPVGS